MLGISRILSTWSEVRLCSWTRTASWNSSWLWSTVMSPAINSRGCRTSRTKSWHHTGNPMMHRTSPSCTVSHQEPPRREAKKIEEPKKLRIQSIKMNSKITQALTTPDKQIWSIKCKLWMPIILATRIYSKSCRRERFAKWTTLYSWRRTGATSWTLRWDIFTKKNLKIKKTLRST